MSGNKAALVLRLQRVVVSAPAASNAPFGRFLQTAAKLPLALAK